MTQRQFDDYITLFRRAADRVLAGHPKFQKEVDKMTKPMIKLPSVRERELEAQLADATAKLKLPSTRERELETQIADRDAEIDRLRKLLARQG